MEERNYSNTSVLGHQNAYDIAERIRESIAAEPMPKINDVQLPNISCSFGVSTYPTHAKTKMT